MNLFHRRALLVACAAYCISLSAIAEDKKPELMTGATTSMLTQSCAGCHGTNGASMGPAIPNIAGLSALYMEETMAAFAEGTTPSTIMGRIAKGYTAAEYKQMGEYFAKQKPHKAAQESDEQLAKKGEKLHDKYCEKCHSEGGSLADDDAGILQGQWQPYLSWSLHDALDGKRKMPKKMLKQLKQLHKKEGDEGLKAVINFYAK